MPGPGQCIVSGILYDANTNPLPNTTVLFYTPQQVIAGNTISATTVSTRSDSTGAIAPITLPQTAVLQITVGQGMVVTGIVPASPTATISAVLSGVVFGAVSGATFLTNGAPNVSQTSLNLANGTGISISNTSGGTVQFTAGVISLNDVVYTGDNTYTKSLGLLYLRVICIGGGGGGGGAVSSASTNCCAGGGGGSGGYSESWLAASGIPTNVAITIGLGGVNGSAAPTAGGNGGTTTFGGLVGANGGSGGGANTDSLGSPGLGGTAGGGHITTSGQAGTSGMITTQPFGISVGGSGGAKGPYMLGGTAFPTAAAANGSGGQNGGGGSGGGTAGVNIASGGPGGAGVVIITEFLGP